MRDASMTENEQKIKESHVIAPSATLLGHSSWSLRCAISGDGNIAISGDGKPSARTWNLSNLSDAKTLCSGKIGIRQCALSYDGAIAAVAEASSRGSVSLFSTSNSKKLFDIPIPKKGMAPAGCALSPDASVLAASFRAANRSKGSIRIVRWKADSPRITEIDREYAIWQILLSSDARRVAYKFWHGTTSGIEIIDPWNDRLFFNLPMPSAEWAFSMDSSASILVTASEWSLRVVPIEDPDAVKTLPGYTFSQFAHCSVSSDGNFVAAPMRNHKFGVWHVPSSTLVNVLVGHSDRTNACSISSDGSRMVTCSNDRTVRLWDLNHDENQSANGLNEDDPILIKSLKLMLDGRYKFSLISETIRAVLVPQSINTVVDLLFAHTIFMISKRTRDLLGSEPIPINQVHAMYQAVVGKLHSPSEAFLAQLIMMHAEQNDVLPENFARKHTGVVINASKQMIEELKITLMKCWRLTSNLPKFIQYDKLEPMLVHQLNSVHDEIENIRSEDHVMLYCAIARCSLFFHPEFLMTLEDFTFGITGTIPTDALLQESKLTGISFLEKLCPFDISSPKVVKACISRDFVSVLSPRSKRYVISAIGRSYFKNENLAQAYLQDLLNMNLPINNIETLKRHSSSSDEKSSTDFKEAKDISKSNGGQERPTNDTDDQRDGIRSDAVSMRQNSVSWKETDSQKDHEKERLVKDMIPEEEEIEVSGKLSSASPATEDQLQAELRKQVSMSRKVRDLSGIWERRTVENPEIEVPMPDATERRSSLSRIEVRSPEGYEQDEKTENGIDGRIEEKKLIELDQREVVKRLEEEAFSSLDPSEEEGKTSSNGTEVIDNSMDDFEDHLIVKVESQKIGNEEGKTEQEGTAPQEEENAASVAITSPISPTVSEIHPGNPNLKTIDLSGVKEVDSPSVMNINVYIVTDDQKTVASSQRVISIDNTLRLGTSQHDPASEATVRDSTASSGSSQEGDGEAGKSGDDPNKDSKLKKKKSKRSKLKKGVLSLAKGARNSFYGKKKPKGTEKEEKDEDDALDNLIDRHIEEEPSTVGELVAAEGEEVGRAQVAEAVENKD